MRPTLLIFAALLLVPTIGAAKPAAKPGTKTPSNQQHTPKSLPGPKAGVTPAKFGREIKVAWQAKGPHGLDDPRFTSHAAALSSFSLRYFDRGHHIHRMGIRQTSEGGVTSELRDRDGDDRYQFSAMYLDLPGVERKETALDRRCHKVCDLAIQAPEGDGILVLTGFLFMRTKTARPLHRLAIRPMPEHGIIRVEFDDGSPISADGEFSAQVQYAYVPAARTKGQHTVTSRSNGSPLVLSTPGAQKKVIQGFDMQFVAQQRPLGEVSIQARQGDFQVRLADGGGDDVFEASVDYVVLKVP